jgi:hypothetical protein
VPRPLLNPLKERLVDWLRSPEKLNGCDCTGVRAALAGLIKAKAPIAAAVPTFKNAFTPDLLKKDIPGIV